MQQQLDDASRELLTLGNELRTQGLTEEELRAVRELGEALRGSITGNPELIEQEFQQLVNLAEQLELKLAANGDAHRARGRPRASADAGRPRLRRSRRRVLPPPQPLRPLSPIQPSHRLESGADRFVA